MPDNPRTAETLAIEFGAMERASLGGKAARAAAGTRAGTNNSELMTDVQFKDVAGVSESAVSAHRATWNNAVTALTKAQLKTTGAKPSAELTPDDDIDSMVSALDGLASFKGDDGKTVKGDNIFTYWYPSAVAKRAKGTTAAADKEAEKAAELAAEIAIAKERAASALKIAQGIESDAGELLLKIQSTYNHAKHYLGDGASANVQKGMAKKYDALEKKAEKSVREAKKPVEKVADLKEAFPTKEELWPSHADKIDKAAVVGRKHVIELERGLKDAEKAAAFAASEYGPADRKDPDGRRIDHPLYTLLVKIQSDILDLRNGIGRRKWHPEKDAATLKGMRHIAGNNVAGYVAEIVSLLNAAGAEDWEAALADLKIEIEESETEQ